MSLFVSFNVLLLTHKSGTYDSLLWSFIVSAITINLDEKYLFANPYFPVVETVNGEEKHHPLENLSSTCTFIIHIAEEFASPRFSGEADTSK